MSACNRRSEGGYCAIVPGDQKVDGEKCKEGCAEWQLVFAVNTLTEVLQGISRNGIGA